MEEDVAKALNAAQVKGATYADVRVLETREQVIVLRNGVLQGVRQSEDVGLGVRVIAEGAWGFASCPHLDRVEETAALAVRTAKASALVKLSDIDIGRSVMQRGLYRTPFGVDPFALSLETKVEVLLQADRAMRRVRGVRTTEAGITFIRQRKIFASTEGSLIEQEILESGCGIRATATREGEVQWRSYPNSGGHQATLGWEFIEACDLPGNGERIAEEAVALLSADPCPSAVTTLILGGAQVALQIHESCGHAVELDRVLGREMAYAGTSFLTPDKLGRFPYGSELVNITADATLPGGLGTCGWDDDGIPAQRVDIVRDGLLVNYLNDRETACSLRKILNAADAAAIPNGSARASSSRAIPLVRMTNVNLLPGLWKLDELIADSNEGIFMDVNRSWSIDDKRLNFQFGCEIAWEIRRGKLVRLLRNPIYTGITPNFWRSCDAICNASNWALWGTLNCAKGEPKQVLRTGHGTAPARFRHVRVFSTE